MITPIATPTTRPLVAAVIGNTCELPVVFQKNGTLGLSSGVDGRKGRVGKGFAATAQTDRLRLREPENADFFRNRSGARGRRVLNSRRQQEFGRPAYPLPGRERGRQAQNCSNNNAKSPLARFNFPAGEERNQRPAEVPKPLWELGYFYQYAGRRHLRHASVLTLKFAN